MILSLSFMSYPIWAHASQWVRSSVLHRPGWPTIHALMVLVGLLLYVLTTHSLQRRRAPAAAISWVLTIVLVPYVALALYLLFGTRKLPRAGRRPPVVPEALAGGEEAWPRELAASMGQLPSASYRKLRVHADGRQARLSLLALVDSAQHDLCLCTFILRSDLLGKELMDHLVARARAGVQVRLMVDAVGHGMAGWPGLQRLERAGVQLAYFGPVMPLRRIGSANLRNHRKLVVADGLRMWCGGRNFAAEYFEGQGHQRPWQDLSFELEGPLAARALDLYERDWAAATGKSRTRTRTQIPPASAAADDCDDHDNRGGRLAQVIASGPDQRDDTLYNLLVTACFKAQSRIQVVTPYFVPDHTLMLGMCLAARRGVRVDVILPSRSNHALADFVRHRAMRELAAAGAQIWLVPYMVHAKLVVFDQVMALAGSANFDARSLFLNYEVMVAFYTAADVQCFADAMEAHRTAAKPYQAQAPGLLRDLGEGLLLWLAFQL